MLASRLGIPASTYFEVGFCWASVSSHRLMSGGRHTRLSNGDGEAIQSWNRSERGDAEEQEAEDGGSSYLTASSGQAVCRNQCRSWKYPSASSDIFSLTCKYPLSKILTFV